MEFLAMILVAEQDVDEIEKELYKLTCKNKVLYYEYSTPIRHRGMFVQSLTVQFDNEKNFDKFFKKMSKKLNGGENFKFN